MKYEYRIPEFDNEWYGVEIGRDQIVYDLWEVAEESCDIRDRNSAEYLILARGGIKRIDVREKGDEAFESFSIDAEAIPSYTAHKYKEDEK